MIYVRAADETWWERAETIAKNRGKSISLLVSDQLRLLVMNNQGGRTPTPYEKLAEASRLTEEALAELQAARSKAETFPTAQERI